MSLPPLEFDPEDFDDVDYICISHIHPDHFDPATLRRMDADIPVVIHDYRWDYLRDGIEALGFDAVERRLEAVQDAVFAVEWEQGCPVGLETAASVVAYSE